MSLTVSHMVNEGSFHILQDLVLSPTQTAQTCITQKVLAEPDTVGELQGRQPSEPRKPSRGIRCGVGSGLRSSCQFIRPKRCPDSDSGPISLTGTHLKLRLGRSHTSKPHLQRGTQVSPQARRPAHSSLQESHTGRQRQPKTYQVKTKRNRMNLSHLECGGHGEFSRHQRL